MDNIKYTVVIDFTTAVGSDDRLSFDFPDEAEARTFLENQAQEWQSGMAKIRLLKVTETELDRIDS